MFEESFQLSHMYVERECKPLPMTVAFNIQHATYSIINALKVVLYVVFMVWFFRIVWSRWFGGASWQMTREQKSQLVQAMWWMLGIFIKWYQLHHCISILSGNVSQKCAWPLVNLNFDLESPKVTHGWPLLSSKKWHQLDLSIKFFRGLWCKYRPYDLSVNLTFKSWPALMKICIKNIKMPMKTKKCAWWR